MGVGKKSFHPRYVKYDIVTEKPLLSTIFFQVWTKYLGMRNVA